MTFCVIIIVMLNSKKRSHNKLKPVQMEDSYQGVELSDEQQRVYNIMESTYDNMFITGKAGTGKSVLLQSQRREKSDRFWRKSSNTWLVRKSNNVVI